jgi:hypothetical protein
LEPTNRVTFRRARDHLSLDDPEDGDEILRRFAAAVILSAMRDVAGRSGKIGKYMSEARAWLLDEENERTWFVLAGVQRRQILAWFEAGCVITRQHKLGNLKQHYKKKIYNQYELKTEPLAEKVPIDPDLGPEY